MSLVERQIEEILRKASEIKSERRSSLLDYLPAMYAGDDFFNRFLCIFEDTIKPLQRMADDEYYYFDALTIPSESLKWLATWVALVLDETWSLEKRRRLILEAVELYSWRGTKRGLSDYIELYTDVQPEISEYVDGIRLGHDARLGINTTIAGRERHSFTVTVRLDDLSDEEIAYKEATLHRIIETEKPAHTAYRLRVLSNSRHF
jgi:phage tail-like protein